MALLETVVFATVLSAYDGDTVKVDINGCNIDVLCKGIEVRLAGYDAPEMHGKCEKEKQLAQQAKELVQQTYPVGSTMVLRNPERDKYFRILADQPIIKDLLLSKGLAVVYNGEKKTKNWCEISPEAG